MIDSYSMQVHPKEPLLLFRQNADHKLHDVSADAGPAFQRGLACAWIGGGRLRQ